MELTNYLVKIKDYSSRSGTILPINLKSPTLAWAIFDAIDYIKNKTKFVPESNELYDKVNRCILYKNLIEFNRNFESKEKNNYGTLRENILGNGGDLGDILWHRAAVCREMSCFGHLVLAMYDINTKVINGNVDGKEHAWLKTKGNTILDFNKYRKIFNSKDYPASRIISEQLLVEKKKVPNPENIFLFKSQKQQYMN